MNPQIFREYDIRGVVGRDLTPDVAELLGKGFGTLAAEHGAKTVSAGRDCRLSSEELKNAVVRGITSTGVDVIDVGLVTTPMLYFSLFNLPVDGGIQVTGSHNPPQDNGFKVCVGKNALHGEDIQGLRRLIESGNFKRGQGKVREQNIQEMYISFVQGNVKLRPGLRLAIDAGNGVAGMVGVPIYERSGCQVTQLYCDPDGRFPNHHPDPIIPANLRDLIKTVREQGLEAGLGYDGDGDRIGVVDERGEILWGDQIMIILSRALLKERPGATIIFDVKCSQTLIDDITKHGGKPIMWRTGHSPIKQKMREENAALAGEMSGHICFADRYFGYDDAVYSSARLMEILSHSGKKMSELLDDVPRMYASPEIRMDWPEETKFKVVEEVKKFFAAKYPIVDVDGVRVIFPDGWGLVRASNTQPALVLRYEANSEKRLKEIQDAVESKLREYKK